MIRHEIVNGLAVRAVDPDEPAGTLLYVHGLGESCLSFEGLLADPRLARWRHLAPDLPGYGKSPWPPEPLGLLEHAEHLAGWIEAVIEGRLVVFGHSMGGVVGMMLCEILGDRVAGFVNVEGNVSPEDCAFSSRIARYTVDELLDHGFARFLDSVYKVGNNDPALRGYYASMRMCDPRSYHRNSLDLVEISAGEGTAARLAALSIPQIFLLGLPRGTVERSRELLTAAAVPWRTIDDAGHWPFLDHPDRFVDELVAFLGSIAADA